jgi:acyl-CoA reductase-like NAD-dependent aldehyde dehydrogenase
MTNLQRLRQFMTFPLAERRKILREQAEKLQQHYEDTAKERLAWQTGDIVETE